MCLSLVYNEIHCSRVLKLIVRELEYSQWLPYANKPPWSSGCTRVEFAFWHKRSVKLKNKMLKNKMIIGIKLKNKMLYRLLSLSQALHLLSILHIFTIDNKYMLVWGHWLHSSVHLTALSFPTPLTLGTKTLGLQIQCTARHTEHTYEDNGMCGNLYHCLYCALQYMVVEQPQPAWNCTLNIKL